MSKVTRSHGLATKLLHNSKMPAFTLYGARGSTNTDRVRLTLAEGGFTDYELVLVNLQKGEQKVGDRFLLQGDIDTSCVSKLHIISSLTDIILVRANIVGNSLQNTRNVTHGVKYP